MLGVQYLGPYMPSPCTALGSISLLFFNHRFPQYFIISVLFFQMIKASTTTHSMWHTSFSPKGLQPCLHHLYFWKNYQNLHVVFFLTWECQLSISVFWLLSMITSWTGIHGAGKASPYKYDSDKTAKISRLGFWVILLWNRCWNLLQWTNEVSASTTDNQKWLSSFANQIIRKNWCLASDLVLVQKYAWRENRIPQKPTILSAISSTWDL